jgi:hypothetical protein
MSRNREKGPEPEQSEQTKRALAFLEEGVAEDSVEVDPVARLLWAQNDRQIVTNTLQAEQQRYRVANAVGDEVEKQAICRRVEQLLFRLDEWDRLISELEEQIEQAKAGEDDGAETEDEDPDEGEEDYVLVEKFAEMVGAGGA